MFRLFIHPPKQVEPAEVEAHLSDGGEAPGGFRVIHVPGHSAGQVALLWPKQGGVLVVADAAANVMGLGISPAYEDLETGLRSLAHLARLEFEVAVFGHGGPILKGAGAAFRSTWAARPVAAEAG
jgi:glyoxylase-like metal-dependent hydrolase (beta-lactamase superfamily II)